MMSPLHSASSAMQPTCFMKPGRRESVQFMMSNFMTISAKLQHRAHITNTIFAISDRSLSVAVLSLILIRHRKLILTQCRKNRHDKRRYTCRILNYNVTSCRFSGQSFTLANKGIEQSTNLLDNCLRHYGVESNKKCQHNNSANCATVKQRNQELQSFKA